MADVKHITINNTTYDIRDDKAARKGMYIGTCTTAAGTAAKVATTDVFPVDGNGKPLEGTVVGIKFSATNTYKTEGTTMTLEVNSTGAYPIYYNNAVIVSTTSANTLCCGYKNRYIYYQFNGTQWVWLTASYETNTTYSAMTQAEIDAGTSTTGKTMTPQRLRDNFYTEGEVDTLLADKADTEDLAAVATSGSYNDLEDTPTIPTVPTNVSSFTNDAGYTTNAGTITGITMNGASKGTSGVVDLGTVITAHQDISGKANASEMSVSTSADQTIITLKTGTSATVINQHQSLNGYAKFVLLADEAAYEALATKDSSTLYLIPEE